MRRAPLLVAFAAWLTLPGAAQTRPPTPGESCFLLHEAGVGIVARTGSACRTRLTPASTFKIPHAIAALDSGVIEPADVKLAYDGSPQPFESWKRDQTLASAMQNSVVWVFREIARRLGMERERDYLTKFDYGNRDASSGLTSFWIGGSLVISPEEQLTFLGRVFGDELPVSPKATAAVREMLVQPAGFVVNAAGRHPFGGKPWPPGTVITAKTGSATDRSAREVRWLVGRVARGARAWTFVSCVAGPDGTPSLAAIELAARSLAYGGVI